MSFYLVNKQNDGAEVFADLKGITEWLDKEIPAPYPMYRHGPRLTLQQLSELRPDENLKKALEEIQRRGERNDAHDEFMGSDPVGCIECRGMKIRFRALIRQWCYRLKLEQSEEIVVWGSGVDDALRRASDAIKNGDLYFVNPTTRVRCCDNSIDWHGTYIYPVEEPSVRWFGEPAENCEQNSLRWRMPEKFDEHPESMTMFEWIQRITPFFGHTFPFEFVFTNPDGEKVRIYGDTMFSEENILYPYIDYDGLEHVELEDFDDEDPWKEEFSKPIWKLDGRASKSSLTSVKEEFEKVRKAYDTALALLGGVQD